MPELTLNEKMNHVKEHGGSLVLNFENGSKIVQTINKKVFSGERDKPRAAIEVLEVFKSISHDAGAISFQIQI